MKHRTTHTHEKKRPKKKHAIYHCDFCDAKSNFGAMREVNNFRLCMKCAKWFESIPNSLIRKKIVDSLLAFFKGTLELRNFV